MWRKPEDSRPQPFSETSATGANAGQQTSSQQNTDRTAGISPNAAACVSQGIKIKGEIRGREDLFIDGTVQGKIHLTEGAVTVGPNGRVNAEIEAREIIVRGEVTGMLKATERVQIWSSGRAIGDVQTRRIAIEDGAVLRGKVEIVQQKDESRSKLTEPYAPAKVPAGIAAVPTKE